MKLKNTFMLLLTAFIWGTAFVAQSMGMDYVEPFTFNGIRSLIGGAVLIPCIWFLGRGRRNDANQGTANMRQSAEHKTGGTFHDLLIGGISCGLLLFIASSLQQIGIRYTTVGKSGFITAFYIVLVPVFGLFLKEKNSIKIWAAVAIALAGLYFLCITERLTVAPGDILLFFCAVAFALHILTVDHFAPKVDGVKMSCLQFFVCGIVSLPFMFIFETPRLSAIIVGIRPILYTGVLSCGVAYTLQILGQKNMNPAIASLIMSLESVFSVLAGWVILGERLTWREYFGCALMFTAVILSQLPQKTTKEGRLSD